jgi:hypothetical protein
MIRLRREDVNRESDHITEDGNSGRRLGPGSAKPFPDQGESVADRDQG